MKKLSSEISLRTLLLLGGIFLAAAATSACGDDPVEEEEHAEVDGIQLVSGGRTLASFDGDEQAWSLDELEIGAPTLIEVLCVHHGEDEGEDCRHDDDDELYLEVEVDNPSVATFEPNESADFRVLATGVAEGHATVVFRIMHGALGSGHADFVTTGLEIHVEMEGPG